MDSERSSSKKEISERRMVASVVTVVSLVAVSCGGLFLFLLTLERFGFVGCSC